MGLHERFLPGESTFALFRYVRDTSSFGFGTPPRSELPLNRFCSAPGNFIICPFTNTTVVVASDDESAANVTYPNGYDITIPKSLQKVYSSGTGENSTIANYFDIEWRRYQKKVNLFFPPANNGSEYLVGANRIMQSLILNNAIEPIEGLLVDMANGAIVFRNHTVPTGFEYGVSWQEDLLSIEPETVCVNTNITIDFDINVNSNQTAIAVNPVLTDRGGFLNLVEEYPKIDLSNSQSNPKLQERAYKAAWMLNAYTML